MYLLLCIFSYFWVAFNLCLLKWRCEMIDKAQGKLTYKKESQGSLYFKQEEVVFFFFFNELQHFYRTKITKWTLNWPRRSHLLSLPLSFLIYKLIAVNYSVSISHLSELVNEVVKVNTFFLKKVFDVDHFIKFVTVFLLLFYGGFFDPEACGILVPSPGIELPSPVLEGKVLTTGLPKKCRVNTF